MLLTKNKGHWVFSSSKDFWRVITLHWHGSHFGHSLVLSYRPLVKECVPKNYFSYFSTKRYVVGTQKNRLNETVLLSTQNIAETDG